MTSVFDGKVELFDVPYAPGYGPNKKQRKYRRLSPSVRDFIERVKTGTAYLAMQLGRLVTDTLSPLPFASKSRKWVNLDSVRVNKLMNMRLHGMPLVTYGTSSGSSGSSGLGESASSFDIAGMGVADGSDDQSFGSVSSSATSASFIGIATTCNVCLPLELKRSTNRDGSVENPDGPLVGKNLCFGWWTPTDKSDHSDESTHHSSQCGWDLDFFDEHKIETALERVQSALAMRGYNLIDATEYPSGHTSGVSGDAPVNFEFRIELISPPWKKFPRNVSDNSNESFDESVSLASAAEYIIPVVKHASASGSDDSDSDSGTDVGYAYDNGSDYDDDEGDENPVSEGKDDQDNLIERPSEQSRGMRFVQRFVSEQQSKTASSQDWRVSSPIDRCSFQQDRCTSQDVRRVDRRSSQDVRRSPTADQLRTLQDVRRRSPPNHQDPRYRRNFSPTSSTSSSSSVSSKSAKDQYVEQPTIPSHIAKMPMMQLITGDKWLNERRPKIGDRLNRPQPLATTASGAYLHPNSRSRPTMPTTLAVASMPTMLAYESYPSGSVSATNSPYPLSPDSSSAAATERERGSGRIRQSTPCPTPDFKPTSPLPGAQGNFIDLPDLHGPNGFNNEWEFVSAPSTLSRPVSIEPDSVATSSTASTDTSSTLVDSTGKIAYSQMCAESRHPLVASLDASRFL